MQHQRASYSPLLTCFDFPVDELDVNNFDQEFTDMDPVLTPTTAVSPSARMLFRGFSFVAPEPLFNSRLFPLPSEIDEDGDASIMSAAPPPLLSEAADGAAGEDTRESRYFFV